MQELNCILHNIGGFDEDVFLTLIICFDFLADFV